MTLAGYLENARWFDGKGRPIDTISRRRLAVVATATTPDEPTVTIDVVRVGYADGVVSYYQLPLSTYADEQERLEHALVEVDDDGYAYDAAHDRTAMAHYLAHFADPTRAVDGVAFRREDPRELDLDTHSTPFAGEQSNTSIAFGEDSLLKLFRKLTPGINPDIEIHRALTAARSEHIAALLGWMQTGDGDEVLQLAMLQQFLRTSAEGWGLAQASVRNLFAEADLHAREVGGDFAAEAERLGAAIAEIHTVLRTTFGETSIDAAEVAETMRSRLAVIADEVDAIEPAVPATETLFDAVAALGTLPTQRIHGDLHLGQTLRTVDGWKVVDFEGEPAKTLAERTRPDSPWRDVAGMLRSFDYAARITAADYVRTVGGDPRQVTFRAAEWSDRNRRKFLAGYTGGRDLTDAEQTLLDAYVADKAVYEVGYEARFRPDWIDIPLAALGVERDGQEDQ